MNLLINNIDWIFSGIGVFALIYIAKLAGSKYIIKRRLNKDTEKNTITQINQGIGNNTIQNQIIH